MRSETDHIEFACCNHLLLLDWLARSQGKSYLQLICRLALAGQKQTHAVKASYCGRWHAIYLYKPNSGTDCTMCMAVLQCTSAGALSRIQRGH